MFFRNLTLFRFSPTVAKSLKDLDAALADHALRACGPLDLITRGFVSPFGPDSEVLSHTIGKATLVSLGSEEKLLPAAVVNAELGKRLRKEAGRRGRPVGGRQRRAIKAEVLDTLLPQAFVRPSRLNAYVDSKNGWLVLDTASRKAAENALTALREALGSFPAQPLAAAETPRALMTQWLAHGKLPSGLSLGDECELRDPAGGAIIRCRKQELESDEVRAHLKQGKQVFQLGLQFEDRASFVLGEDLVIRKLRFLDVVQDSLDADGRDSAEAELDARFALMTLELERLFEGLQQWFGLERPDESNKKGGMIPQGDFLELATGKGGTIKVLKAMHPRARRLRLSVTSHGARISYPRGTHPAQVYAFLRENSDWLERKLSELRVPRRGPPPLKPGMPTLIPLRGESVELTWRESEYPRIEFLGDELRLHVPRPFTTAMPAARNLLAAFLETHMRRDLSRWMAHASERLDAAPTGLRIKSLKSLWGSLDARDRITLDLALALAPPAALRYVLVHEMCHLKVRSHSPRFWARVGEVMPGYQAQRDWLREHGAILKAEMERLIAPDA